MADHILIPISDCELTLSEFMAEAERLQAEHPEWEVFLDGDAYALVGRDRS
jgi:hypothetical protein